MPATAPRVVTKTIRLHRAQIEYRKSTALYRGYVGGRGSGKSWVGAYDLIRRAQRDRLYMVGAPTYQMLSDSTFRTFCGIARDLGVLTADGIRRSPPGATLTTGAEILFRSADDPERFRGPNLSGCWLDEASLMHADAYGIAIACLRERGEQGWLSATFTPKGLTHWTYDVFATGKPHTALFHSRTADNPFLPAEFAETVRSQNPGRISLQELDGQFINPDGAEWPGDWFDGILFDDWPGHLPTMTRVMALDPSKGRADNAGDYSAWIMLAVEHCTPPVLWLDADMSNTRPVEPSPSNPDMPSIVGDGYALMRAFRPAGVLIETNGFQELVAAAFLRYCTERRTHAPIHTLCNVEPKVQRIRQLGPYLAQRRIRVRNTPGGRLLVQQLRDFPVGEHDDGPDATKLAEVMADYLIHGAGAMDRAPNLLAA